MDMIEEIMYDFELKKSRTLMSSNLAIVDNVKQLVVVGENSVIVSNGKEFTAISGTNLIIKELADCRMQVKGNIYKVEIYGNDKK